MAIPRVRRAGQAGDPVMKPTPLRLIALCLAFSWSAATAAPVSWAFTGSTYSVEYFGGPNTGPVQVGSPLSGVFTFDASLPDLLPDNPISARYAIGDSGNIAFQIGGLSSDGFQYTDVPLAPSMHIVNDQLAINSPIPSDTFSVFANMSSGNAGMNVQMLLLDISAQMLTSDAIPAMPPDPAPLCCVDGVAYFQVTTVDYIARAHLETITVVPEPASIMLVALAGLLIHRRQT